VSVNLLYILWDRYFSGQPGFLLPLAALVIGFSNPSFWMLGRPGVYETAIASGQFFMMLGLLLAFIALTTVRQMSTMLLLILSGASLACAVGSRALLAPAVIFIGLVSIWQITKQYPGFSRFPVAVLSFGVPLLVGAGLLLGYNFARFNDPFEIGLRYQLTGPAMENYDAVTSVKYFIPNLYNYMMRPPLLEGDFPYVNAIFITETMWPFFIRLPGHYVYHEPTVGILMMAPTLVFVIGYVGGLFLPTQQHLKKIGWLLVCLAGSLVITGGLLMVYIFSAMRFQYEFVLSGNLLAVLGFWSARKLLGERPRLQKMFSGLFVFSAITAIFSGLLLGMGEPTNRFEEINPLLYYTIALTLNGLW